MTYRREKLVLGFGLSLGVNKLITQGNPLRTCRNPQDLWNQSAQDEQSTNSEERGADSRQDQQPDHHRTLEPNREKTDECTNAAQKEETGYP